MRMRRVTGRVTLTDCEHMKFKLGIVLLLWSWARLICHQGQQQSLKTEGLSHHCLFWCDSISVVNILFFTFACSPRHSKSQVMCSFQELHLMAAVRGWWDGLERGGNCWGMRLSPHPHTHTRRGQVLMAYTCCGLKPASLLPARCSPCRQVLMCSLPARYGWPVPGLNQQTSEIQDRQRTKLQEYKVKSA